MPKAARQVHMPLYFLRVALHPVYALGLIFVEPPILMIMRTIEGGRRLRQVFVYRGFAAAELLGAVRTAPVFDYVTPDRRPALRCFLSSAKHLPATSSRVGCICGKDGRYYDFAVLPENSGGTAYPRAVRYFRRAAEVWSIFHTARAYNRYAPDTDVSGACLADG
jgi:hypothetical protein